MDVPQDLEVVPFVVEVAERSEDVYGEVEGFRAHEAAHVLLYPFDIDTFCEGPSPSPSHEK